MHYTPHEETSMPKEEQEISKEEEKHVQDQGAGEYLI